MEVREVHDSPALGRLFARAVLTQHGRGGDLPARALRRSGVVTESGRLLDYQHLCRFPGGDVLPHTYPHVLGFPLQVQLMAERDFPLPLPGLVHLANQVTVHRALTARDRLDLTVHAEHLRPHPRGTLVDLVTRVDVEGALAWQGRSTYLRRGAAHPDAPVEPHAPAVPDGPPTGVVRLPEGLGRAYAAVSGDVNPIHLHRMSARAMGFPRAIAHGMWTAARTLAVLGPVASGPSASHVWFAKPVLLPSTVELVVADSPAGRVAAMRSAQDPSRHHLVLTLATASS